MYGNFHPTSALVDHWSRLFLIDTCHKNPNLTAEGFSRQGRFLSNQSTETYSCLKEANDQRRFNQGWGPQFDHTTPVIYYVSLYLLLFDNVMHIARCLEESVILAFSELVRAVAVLRVGCCMTCRAPKAWLSAIGGAPVLDMELGSKYPTILFFA